MPKARRNEGSGNCPTASTRSWKSRNEKAAPSRSLRGVACLLDLDHPDHVAERLPRHPDVAVDLDHGIGVGLAGLLELRDGRFAGPPQHVDPRVRDQPGRAMRLVVEHAEPLPSVQIEPHLVGEPLGIEAPALAVRAPGERAAEPAERRASGRLLFERDLEMVAGVRLVVGDRRDMVHRAIREVVRVDVVDPGTRAVFGRRVVERERLVGLTELLDPADLAVGAREPSEE